MDIGGTPPPQGANSASLTVPSFYTTFPLPYRVLFLAGLGILLWALNLHILHLLGLDTGFILGVRSRSSPDGEPDDLAEEGAILLASGGSPAKTSFARSRELVGPVYGLLGAYTAWSFAGWLVFRWLVGGDDQDRVDAWRLLPLLTALGAVIGLVAPYNGLWRRERQAFVRSLRRCVSSPVGQPILFCDVITADILTSFAKVIGDAWVSACLILGGKLASSQLEGAGSGLGEWVVPFMVSIPYLIRLRQCLIEWASSDYKNGRPLANALKYASAFPVILFSAVQKVVVEEVRAEKGTGDLGDDTWHGEHPLFRLWLLSVFVNSMYSFWWDVTNDWGLKILDSNEWGRVDVASPTSRSGSTSGLLRSPSLAPHRRSKSIVARALGRLPTFATGASHAQHSRGHSRSMSLTHARSEPPSPDRSLPAVSGQATAANGYFPPTPTGSDHPHYAASRANHGQAPSLAGTTLLYPPPLSHQASPAQATYPRGLRAERLFSETTVYYLAIVVDLVLRFTWSLKLSSKLHTISEIESGVFMMEVLELLRRWMWVFFRMEWEEIRKTEADASLRRRGSTLPQTTLFEQDDDEDIFPRNNGGVGTRGPAYTDASDPLADSRGPSPREKMAGSLN